MSKEESNHPAGYFNSTDEFGVYSRYGKIDEFTQTALCVYLKGDLPASFIMQRFYDKYCCKADKGKTLSLEYSNEDIAEENGICLSTVKRAIKKLIELQLITRIKIGKGRGGKSEYIINRKVIYEIVKAHAYKVNNNL